MYHTIGSKLPIKLNILLAARWNISHNRNFYYDISIILNIVIIVEPAERIYVYCIIVWDVLIILRKLRQLICQSDRVISRKMIRLWNPCTYPVLSTLVNCPENDCNSWYEIFTFQHICTKIVHCVTREGNELIKFSVLGVILDNWDFAQD